MLAECRTSYDQVPYEGHSYPQAQPDRLATVATLLGLSPPPVTRCRVLELGCAAGANLIPLAVALPGSTFLGLDLSARQVEEGRQVIAALGLDNIRLEARSIAEVGEGEGLGTFDYILCHGVYSWVPAQVQDAILATCARNLAPGGVAYVSYNTYPGRHLCRPIRDLLLYHTRQVEGPPARLAAARGLLQVLTGALRGQDGPQARLLEHEFDLLGRLPDSYVFHEHLEEINEPVYFLEFARRAAEWGLRYLAEAQLGTMALDGYAPEVQEALRAASPDLIHLEQYLDFLRNRTFRETLLCHQELAVDYRLSAERLRGLYVASPAQPLATDEESFTSPSGATVKSTDPLARAALLCLGEIWPRAVSFEELCRAARARLGDGGSADADRDRQIVGQCLLACYLADADGLAYLWTHPPSFAAAAADRPVASPLARLQATHAARATNLRHQTIALDDFHRAVLCRLDGTCDRAALERDLGGAVEGALTCLAANAFLLPLDSSFQFPYNRFLAAATGQGNKATASSPPPSDHSCVSKETNAKRPMAGYGTPGR
jgi:methyltransferase-like protein